MDIQTWRLTRNNPVAGINKPTYRIPFVTDELFREEYFLGSKVILGQVADTLGKYEDLGSINELSNMKKELLAIKRGKKENVDSSGI